MAAVTVRLDIEVTDEDIEALLSGVGAAMWPWWDGEPLIDDHDVIFYLMDTSSGEESVKRVRRSRVRSTLAKFAADKGLFEVDRIKAFLGQGDAKYTVDMGEFDANLGDQVLQLVVYGEVVYG